MEKVQRLMMGAEWAAEDARLKAVADRRRRDAITSGLIPIRRGGRRTERRCSPR
jgi:hypothetical protein